MSVYSVYSSSGSSTPNSHASLSRQPSLESISSLGSSSDLASNEKLDGLNSVKGAESPISAIEMQTLFLCPPIHGPSVWDSTSFGPSSYTTTLDPLELRIIDAAITHFKRLSLPLADINAATFPLPPSLRAKLSSLSRHIHQGAGVSVVRGLRALSLSPLDSIIAFCGLTSHVAPQRATDGLANQTLTHIHAPILTSPPPNAPGLAGSKLPVPLAYHSDRFSGDILALYLSSLGPQGSGGEQFLCSFHAIYNALLARAPDVLQTLASPDWPWEVKRAISLPSGQTKLEASIEYGPALFFTPPDENGARKPMLQLVYAPLTGTPTIPRPAHFPSLNEAQKRALSIVQSTARELGIQIHRQEGDIVLVHNLSVLHARAEYEVTPKDRPGNVEGRHLLRLFLRDPEFAWEKPDEWRHKFDEVFDQSRGLKGEIPVEDTDPWFKVSGINSHG